MKSIYQQPEPTEVPTLSVSPKKAAAMLSISERTQWGLTMPRGPIKAFKIGVRTYYSIEALREYVQKSQEQAEAAHATEGGDSCST